MLPFLVFSCLQRVSYKSMLAFSLLLIVLSFGRGVVSATLAMAELYIHGEIRRVRGEMRRRQQNIPNFSNSSWMEI